MPQTRFVLDKALTLGLKPVVIINKVDKPMARVEEVHEKIFDLFVELNASHDQLDFPLLYASGRDGWATDDPDGPRSCILPVLDAILSSIPPPPMHEGPVQMQVATLDHSDYLGRIGVGRVYRGSLKKDSRLALLRQRGGRALLVAVVLALVTFMASLAHGTGNLLVPLLGAWIMGRSDPGLRKHRFALLCVFAAAHTVFLFLGRPLFLCWIGDPPGSGLVAWLQQWFDAEGWAERVVHLALWEVLVPFLPLSLIVLLPFVRKHRWHTGWAIAGFVPYGLLCVLVLRDPEIDEPMWEHGSYLLPLAIPAGWIVVHSLGHLSHRAWAGVLALSLVASVTFTLQHDTRPGEEWGSDARAILDERSTILWAGSIELPWALIETPRVRVLHTIEGWASAAKDFGAWQSATRRLIDEHLAGGGRMLLSRHARSDLENPQFKLIGAPMWAFFEKTWKLQPLQSGGFEGWEMVR